jgi:long-subunit acyl-CoA synthetase (AMP-forming)
LISNSDCKLLDDDGNEVGDGEPGELWVRGPQICKGYWRNEEATREALQGGWLKTGDVAICRKGWYWIVDRKKVWLLLR